MTLKSRSNRLDYPLALVADLGPTIDRFFAELEADSRGWTGERQWCSLEGQLEIIATIDRLGHILCDITLRDSPGPQGWTTSILLIIESGEQLSVFARGLREQFKKAASE